MNLHRKKNQPTPPTEERVAQEGRLVAAETRSHLLLEKASWLHTMVSRRDQENHWQDSVNRLFLGGN